MKEIKTKNMNNNQLIVKQQLQIEELKDIIANNEIIKNELHRLLFSIGAPMNDNLLQFNKNQIAWCGKIACVMENRNCIGIEKESEYYNLTLKRIDLLRAFPTLKF